MIKYISFVAKKGGVAKSTSAIHLAYWLSEPGFSVTVIDDDANRTALKWRAKANDNPKFDILFISAQWKKLIYAHDGDKAVLVRRQLEACLFNYLATELKTGDACVPSSEDYADYREQFLSWQECQPLLEQYCQELEIPSTASEFV